MAETILSGLVSDLLGRLTSVTIQESGLLRGFKDDLLTLEGYFKDIQHVLQDAEFEKRRRMDLNTFESWLKDLRSESLKMENVLDEVSTSAMLRNLHKKLGIKYKVRALFSFNHNQLIFRYRIAHEVKAIRKKIGDIAAKRSQLSFTPGVIIIENKELEREMPNRETSSLILSPTIYGRDEEVEMVTQKICNTDIGKHDAGDILVYAIWGMGGLGKTTLAQLVYHHERVNKYFEIKCWMYVSEKFQVKELIRGIIESIDKRACRLSQLDDMQACLQNKLRGKKFLIVLDDVWIEESEKTKWEILSRTLSCGAEGSIIMVTTRSKTTSTMMAKDPELQYKLGCLSDKDSWSLFEKLAFAEGREGGERRELEPIGKEITKKCKGLPLAIKTLGGLMWSKCSRSEWECVKNSDIWELEVDILPALKLSYDNLLPHLKRCFAYCCLFPKGYQMKKTLLIDLWMSNGLIPTKGETNWYVLGEAIINSLIWKSFFQVFIDDRTYGLPSFIESDERYTMHDLMHDLAQYVMRYDCSVIEPGKELIIPHEVLHLSSSCPDILFSSKDLEKLTSLRSMFIFSHRYESSISHIFKHMKYLRVLYLAEMSISTLPESICKLKHLRYLNMSWSKIEILSDCIIYLQNLRVLVVDFCMKLRELPKRIRYMRNVQHLHNEGCFSLIHFPIGINKLTSLQKISEFKVSKKNEGAQIGELRDLNRLGGDLILSHLENVGGLEAAKSANMKNKKEISCLTLVWLATLSITDPRADEEVLEGLEPNENLKELTIREYMGSSISPTWMVNLKNLVEIKFIFCVKCKYILPLGKLPSLMFIRLEGMNDLKCFHDDDNNTLSCDNILFPSLQELAISQCSNFVSLPNSIRNLKKLEIRSCESLCSLPDEIQSFKDLKQLVIYNCTSLRRRYQKDFGVDWSKISHIPNVSISGGFSLP